MNEQIEAAPDAQDDASEPRVKALLPTGKAVMARLSHCLLEDQVRLAVALLARNRGVFEVSQDFELEPPLRVAVEFVGEYQDDL